MLLQILSRLDIDLLLAEDHSFLDNKHHSLLGLFLATSDLSQLFCIALPCVHSCVHASMLVATMSFQIGQSLDAYCCIAAHCDYASTLRHRVLYWSMLNQLDNRPLLMTSVLTGSWFLLHPVETSTPHCMCITMHACQTLLWVIESLVCATTCAFPTHMLLIAISSAANAATNKSKFFNYASTSSI